MSWSPSGRLLCAGVGDGSCAILRAEGRRLVKIGRMGSDEGGHGSAVAGVCFAGFGLCDQRDDLAAQLSAKIRKSGEAEDRLMISAGNDGTLIFWDLGGNMVGNGPLDPVLYLDKCLLPPVKRGADDNTTTQDTDEKKTNDATNTKAMKSLEISNNQTNNSKKKPKKGKQVAKELLSGDEDLSDELLLTPSPPKVLFKIAHGQKPNWITCSRASDTVLPTSLFVADTTNNISIYTLPL